MDLEQDMDFEFRALDAVMATVLVHTDEMIKSLETQVHAFLRQLHVTKGGVGSKSQDRFKTFSSGVSSQDAKVRDMRNVLVRTVR